MEEILGPEPRGKKTQTRDAKIAVWIQCQFCGDEETREPNSTGHQLQICTPCMKFVGATRKLKQTHWIFKDE